MPIKRVSVKGRHEMIVLFGKILIGVGIALILTGIALKVAQSHKG